MDIRLKNRTFICLMATGLVLLAALFLTMAATQVAAEPAVADLSGSSITVDHAEALAGTQLQYTIVISNSGDDLANTVRISNSLPAEVEVVGAVDWPDENGVSTSSFSFANNVVSWSGFINSETQATVQYTVLISDSVVLSSTLVNSADITYNTVTTTLQISTTTLIIAEADDKISYLPIVTVPAAPPTVSASNISESGNNYQWTVSWQTNTSVDNPVYLLQESDSADFDTILNETMQSDLSESFSRAPSTDNVRYYRVRLASGAGSPWSESVRVISAYHDNFSNSNTGWKIVRQDLDDTSNSVVYRPNDGVLLVDTGGRWDYTIASPLQPAVNGDYRLKTRVQFAGPGNLNTYGFILGADWNGEACPTLPYRNNPSREVSALDDLNEINPLLDGPAESRGIAIDNCFNHYYRIIALWNGHPNDMQLQVKKIRFHEDEKNSGRGPEFVSFIPVRVSSNNTNGNNEWTVEVRRNGNFKVFSGSRLVAEWNDTEFVDDSYWGFWSSTDEYPGSDPLFDYVTVEPLD